MSRLLILAMLLAGCSVARASDAPDAGFFVSGSGSGSAPWFTVTLTDSRRVSFWSNGKEIAYKVSPDAGLVVMPGKEREALNVCIDAFSRQMTQKPDVAHSAWPGNEGKCMFWDRSHPPVIDACDAGWAGR